VALGAAVLLLKVNAFSPRAEPAYCRIVIWNVPVSASWFARYREGVPVTSKYLHRAPPHASKCCNKVRCQCVTPGPYRMLSHEQKVCAPAEGGPAPGVGPVAAGRGAAHVGGGAAIHRNALRHRRRQAL